MLRSRLSVSQHELHVYVILLSSGSRPRLQWILSLIPRPYHHPVLIACSMRKQKEKTWSILSCEWHQCLPGKTEGGEGSLVERMHFTHAFFILNQEGCVFFLCLANTWNSSAWDRNYKKRPQARSFNWGRFPPSVYLGRHWRHSCDKMDQAFPLHFCTLQVTRNRMVGRPGNKAIIKSCFAAGSWFLLPPCTHEVSTTCDTMHTDLSRSAVSVEWDLIKKLHVP